MSKRGLNIHKRKDGRWEGRLCIGRSNNGLIKYKSVYGKTYGEVKELLMHSDSLYQQISRPIGNEKTFSEILYMWIENNRIKNKGSTVTKYQNLINSHIIPTLGEVKITKITSVMINSFLREKLENGRLDGQGGLSPSYVRSIMIIIKSAMKFAAEEQLCEPMKSAILKPFSLTKEPDILSHNEQKKLESSISFTDDPTELGIIISLHTGMRIGEVCALAWNDIDYENRIIKVRHTIARVRNGNLNSSVYKLIVEEPKTRASARDIPISKDLTAMLRRVQALSVSEYVVSNTKGFVSPRTYEYRYHRILEMNGITQVNYHTLRHTFATRCIEAGVDVKSLSEILGHSNVSVTLNTYVHSSMDMKRYQLEKVFALL